MVEPADGGDELCSAAPPEVSALPDCGMVADLDASGGTVFAVGGFEGGNEFSVAITGVNPMASAVTVIARRRVMTSFFPVANCEQRCGLELRSFRRWDGPLLRREERPLADCSYSSL